MIALTQALSSWNSSGFEQQLKQEIEQLKPELLPLQQGLSLSSAVSHEPFKVMVIGVSDDATTIRVKTGVFYSGIIAGCSCSDDPTPTDLQAEYCELLFVIDKATAATRISLIN